MLKYIKYALLAPLVVLLAWYFLIPPIGDYEIVKNDRSFLLPENYTNALFLTGKHKIDQAPPFLEVKGNLFLRRTQPEHTAVPVDMSAHRGKWVFIAFGFNGDRWAWGPNEKTGIRIAETLSAIKNHVSGNIETWFVRVNYFQKKSIPIGGSFAAKCGLEWKTNQGVYSDDPVWESDYVNYYYGQDGSNANNHKLKCVDRFFYSIPHNGEVNDYFNDWLQEQLRSNNLNVGTDVAPVWPWFMLVDPEGNIVANWGRGPEGNQLTLRNGSLINSIKGVIDNSSFKSDVDITQASDIANSELNSKPTTFRHNGCKTCPRIATAIHDFNSSSKAGIGALSRIFDIEGKPELIKQIKESAIMQKILADPDETTETGL